MAPTRSRLNDDDADSEVMVIKTVKPNPAKRNDPNAKPPKRKALAQDIKREEGEGESPRKSQKGIDKWHAIAKNRLNEKAEKAANRGSKHSQPSPDKKKEERISDRNREKGESDTLRPNNATNPQTPVVEEVEAPIGNGDQQEEPVPEAETGSIPSQTHRAEALQLQLLKLRLEQMDQEQKIDREVQKNILDQIKQLQEMMNANAAAPAAQAPQSSSGTGHAAAATLHALLNQHMGAPIHLGLDDPASNQDKEWWNRKFMSLECPRGCGKIKGADSVSNRGKHYKTFHYQVYFKMMQKSMKHLEQWLCLNFGEPKHGVRVCVLCDGSRRWPDYKDRVELAQHMKSAHATEYRKASRDYEKIAAVGYKIKPDIAMHAMLTAK